MISGFVGNPNGAEAIRDDLARLARFGANITDAHSCFIFLPLALLAPSTHSSGSLLLLELGGVHSLSNDIDPRCRIAVDCGLVGWVARHGRSVHVSPFEHESRTLGIYTSDQELKSFIAVPLPLTRESAKESNGVLACDSKKSFAFSKLQGKLLEDLAREIVRLVELTRTPAAHGSSDWRGFLARSQALCQALGTEAVEILRLTPSPFHALEAAVGAGRAIEMYEQVVRLIEQALPPHFPLFHLPNGELAIALDRMMSGFYENKISALVTHFSAGKYPLSFTFFRKAPRKTRDKGDDFEQILMGSPQAAAVPPSSPQEGRAYGYRRA